MSGEQWNKYKTPALLLESLLARLKTPDDCAPRITQLRGTVFLNHGMAHRAGSMRRSGRYRGAQKGS